MIIEITKITAQQGGVIASMDFWTGRSGRIECEGIFAGHNLRFSSQGTEMFIDATKEDLPKFAKAGLFTGITSAGLIVISAILA